MLFKIGSVVFFLIIQLLQAQEPINAFKIVIRSDELKPPLWFSDFEDFKKKNPVLPEHLLTFEISDCYLTEIPDCLKNVKSIDNINIYGGYGDKLYEFLNNMDEKGLTKSITINDTRIVNLDILISKFTNIEYLKIKNSLINDLFFFNSLDSLKYLTIESTRIIDYDTVKVKPGFKLERLVLSNLKEYPSLNFCKRLINSIPVLKSLSIIDCGFHKFPQLNHLKDLSEIEIRIKDTVIFQNILGGLSNIHTFKFACKIRNYDSLLNQLKHSYDKLKGLIIELPDQDRVPAAVFKMKNLEYLSVLYLNSISSKDSFDLLENLKILNIYQTPLKTFPSSILNLKNLKVLELAGAQISKIPDNITKLKNTLTRLSLDFNPLSEKDIEKVRKLLPNTEITFSK